MPGLSINVYVSPRAAILAGKTVVGNQTCVVTETDLQTLTEALRHELALVYESSEALGNNPSEPAVVAPTFEAIVPVLTARAEARKKIDTAALVAGARLAEQALVDARALAQKDNERSKALRLWVGRNGDDDQRARMAEGFLKEEEILEDVTADVIDLHEFRVYEPLHRGDACDCGCAYKVEFTRTQPPQYLDARQFAKLQAVREAAPEGASVAAVEHRAACTDCKCVPIARISALVTYPWNGWELVREFSLD
jgi:hypothetical protein